VCAGTPNITKPKIIDMRELPDGYKYKFDAGDTIMDQPIAFPEDGHARYTFFVFIPHQVIKLSRCK
jgi:hypothetical protein